MRQKQKYFLIVLLITEHICFGQNLVRSSKVVDSETKEPIPYVNIIIKDKLIGTFSDENGFFSIQGNKQDSLIISHVGYIKKVISIEGVKDVIELKSLPNILNEVTVTSSRKLKSESLGLSNRKVDTYMAGVLQYALFIENKEGRVGFIKKLHFELGHSVNRGKENKRLAKIRVRVYEKDPVTAKPGMDILRKEKIFTVKPNQKVVNVDVSEEYIAFPSDGLFVGIDILGYVDESGKLTNYHISDAKKHIRIPLTTEISAPLTFVNPIGQKWVISQTLSPKSGSLVVANACFGVVVEF